MISGPIASSGRICSARPAVATAPGMPQTAELERCLAAARREIPAGTVVAFSSPDDPPGAAFYRWRWAAYLMPAHGVVRDGEPGARPQYRIACGPGGRLQRVKP